MDLGFKDKMKLMKILSSEEGRDAFKEMLTLKLMSQRAQETTAACITEGLKKFDGITEVTLSVGKDVLLPLAVKATSGDAVFDVESIQPEDADFDYFGDICEKFNPVVAQHPEEFAVFLEKTAQLLENISNEKNEDTVKFSVKIGEN